MARAKESAKRDRFAYNKNLEAAKMMPPLYHTIPGEAFDIKKSEVVKWLLEQPEIMQFVMDRVSSRGETSKLIVYDRGTGKWQGVDYNGD